MRSHFLHVAGAVMLLTVATATPADAKCGWRCMVGSYVAEKVFIKGIRIWRQVKERRLNQRRPAGCPQGMHCPDEAKPDTVSHIDMSVLEIV